MATLLIILIGTVLIQGSTLAMNRLNHEQVTIVAARAVFADEFRSAAMTHSTLIAATLYGYAVQHYLLTPLNLAYLQTPLLLLGVASIFSAARTALNVIPGAVRWPNVLAHLTTQSALLGMALFSASYAESFFEALAYGIGSATVLATLSACFQALRERIELQDVPVAFRGIPIALITAGFIALALMGFAGMVRQ